MAKDLSDVYEAIRVAESEGRTADVQALIKYLESQEAAEEPRTYDPREQVSGMYGAATGAVAGAAGVPMIESGLRQVQAGRIQPPPQVSAPAPGGLTPGSLVDEATSKGISNEITQQTRTAQRAARTDLASENLRKLQSQGVRVNPNILAEMPTQYARPGSGLLIDVETARRMEAEELAKRGGKPPLPKDATVAQKIANKAPSAGDIKNFAKGIYNYRFPIVGAVGPVLGRGLLGAGAGLQATDMYNRAKKGDYIGSAISGLGALGTAGTLVPHPIVRGIGTGVGLSAEALNALRDRINRTEGSYGEPSGSLSDAPGVEFASGGSTTPAWQRKEGKNPEGGLNALGRASYNRETGGNLKAPQPEGGSRKKSFCARMGGMKKKLTSSKTANDPDSRINKALRKWKC